MAHAETAEDSPALISRRLLRAARVGSLGTVIEAQPFTTLVTPATAPDLSILLLLSTLSEHTRHLMADPRCSLLVVGPPVSANPQTAPRVTITGIAEKVADPALKARWLAVHPYGALYADFADFALWRIRPRQGLFVGGFARAKRLREADLAPDPAAVAAVAAAAGEIMAHCNQDHADALRLIARQALEEEPTRNLPAESHTWNMVGVDVDGCDLALGERVIRVAWEAPVSDPGDVRSELARLARLARGG
ncbi:conserved protein of unknown function [Rhodovastum atsumiense]|uniref:DUF2470 domain-containing protein n=1 Tax=Rhodovastum atsumiense TaxID=504468 RepID=A0A5M6IPY2_9PROT|nr:DUF2470 domain-containing protein [Rhodovastum atsumiense]KAA5610343.1 DUF2470 domain-containing protein [Rhodovastum atsumiense]CAH2600915.1 conserved protein of unknown function [Rhodovastum atsumiense]